MYVFEAKCGLWTEVRSDPRTLLDNLGNYYHLSFLLSENHTLQYGPAEFRILLLLQYLRYIIVVDKSTDNTEPLSICFFFTTIFNAKESFYFKSVTKIITQRKSKRCL